MSWNGKSVLVTGSSGFIGSHLVKKLVSLGAKVIAIDIATPKITILDPNLEIINFDITSGKLPVKGKIDTVFHLAAYAIPNACENKPSKAFSVNVEGLFNVLKFAEEEKIEKFVFNSSAYLYGNNPRYLPIDEKHPINSIQNVYSITKKLGEDLCMTFKEHSKMSITILRLFNTFGPLQDFDYLIPTIINQAIRKGVIELWSDKPSKDFNYVENTVDALVKAGESSFDGIFNVGSGEENKVKDIANYIASEFDADVKFLDKEVLGSLHLICDYSKIKAQLGWEPRIGFREGLMKTVDWYKKQFDNANEN